MTLLEVLVVLGTLLIVFALLVPRARPGRPFSSICLSHLRQIDLAFQMYAEDNKGDLPMQISTNDSGTMEFLSQNETFPHYQKLSGYLLNEATLLCPTDKNRHPATNYLELTDTNLSYFLNADTSTNQPSTSILAGDRNLQANGHPVSPGLFTLTTKLDMGWTAELHPNLGMLAFADGHAEFCRTANLNDVIRQQRIAVNHLSIP